MMKTQYSIASLLVLVATKLRHGPEMVDSVST